MIEILPYSPEYKPYFYSINKEWITTMFAMEDIDRQVLMNPQEMILEKGGFIWFARSSKYGIVGTCALRKKREREYELTKMGVLSQARGLKIGEALLQHVIDFVIKQKLGSCYLLTNSDCEAAIHLYEKNGFQHAPDLVDLYGREYARCNVAMRLKLEKSTS